MGRASLNMNSMLKYAQVRGAVGMILLKPGGRFRRLPAGFNQTVDVLAENRVAQHALDLVARDGLQDHPGVVRDLPKVGIKRTPHLVGSVIPRPAHIQGKFRQGIEPFDFGG